MTARASWALAVALAAACSPERPPPASTLYTLDDMLTAARAGGTIDGIPALALVTPASQALPGFSPPYAAAAQFQSANNDGINVMLAFSEGQPAAYVITEVWHHLPALWIQPLYRAATFDQRGPTVVPNGRAVFGVGAKTRFYSPFWRVIYFELPPGANVDDFRSEKQILDAKLPLHEGAGRLCSIAPEGVEPARPASSAAALRPLFGDRVGAVHSRVAWLDGQEIWFVDFGNDRFTWDEQTGIINESALFKLSVRATDGSLQPVDLLPGVGGTGPLYAHAPEDAPNGRPRYGALWHEYNVLIPAGAGVFVTSQRAALRAQVAAAGVLAPPVDPAIEARPDAASYQLRVARNPACFTDPANFPATCRWLDSQSAIEELPVATIADTDRWLSCPFVHYDGKAVDP